MFAYCGNNPALYLDDTGHFAVVNPELFDEDFLKDLIDFSEKAWNFFVDGTVSYGISGSAGFGGHIQYGFCVAYDENGNIAIMKSFGGGGGTPGASVQYFKSTTNAPTIDALEGYLFYAGGSANVFLILSAGVDASVFQWGNEIYSGFDTSVGVGVNLPAPIEVHAGLSNSQFVGNDYGDWRFNLFDWLRSVLKIG